MAPVAMASHRTKGVAAYVMTAATTKTRRYSRTFQRLARDDAAKGSAATRSRVCREAADEVSHLRADLLGRGMVGVAVALGHRPRYEVRDALRLGGAHALGRHRGRAHPDP